MDVGKSAMRRRGFAGIVLALALIGTALALVSTGLGGTGARHAKTKGPVFIGKGGGFGEVYRARASTLAKTLFQARLLPVNPAARNIALAGLGRSERRVNLNLALQCLGLGGWTYTGYIARYVLGGVDVPGLGFRFAPAGEGPSVPVGRDGVYEAFTPPYYADMREAVDAFLEAKWAHYEPTVPKPYREPDRVISQIQRPDVDTIELVKDYCQYVHETHGRFPAYIDPMYQRLTCQAQHVDPDFYAAH